MTPKVSVVLPVWNGERYVAEAIRSIQRQTFADWELIVLDDGSSDGSLEVCRELARSDERLAVYDSPANGGLGAAMSRLVSLARGEYVAIQEQDDVSLPERLAAEVAVLEADPEIGLVSGIAAWIDDDGQLIRHFPGILESGRQYPANCHDMVRFLYLERCKVVNAGAMFRRSALRHDDVRFDPQAKMSVDWQFFLRLAHHHRIVGLHQVLVRVRRGRSHPSLTRQKALQFREGHRCIEVVFREYRDDPRSPIDRWLYRRAKSGQRVIEGAYEGGFEGALRLIQALGWDPGNRRAWSSLAGLGLKGIRKARRGLSLSRSPSPQSQEGERGVRLGRSRSPEPASILFTIPNFITAGSGRALLNIVSRLDRRRFAPAVCVQRKGGALDREVEELGIPFLEAPFTLSARPFRSLPWRVRRVAAPFRPHRFTLWHSFHYLDDYTEPLVARSAGARGWIYTKKNMNWWRRAWYVRSWLARRVVAQNTDMLRDFFASPVWRRKVRHIPRGVDTLRFRPVEAPDLTLRSELGISPQATVVGCVAHLVPVKGHSTLLEAAARLPGLEVLLAGQTTDRKHAESLRCLAQELGVAARVHFLGQVGDVAALLRELDVFVLPTWNRWRVEGCPVALLEAMASGCACIATDVAGSHDLIDSPGCGRLVAPEDPAALADALRSLAASPELRRSLGEAARRRVVEQFSIEREVELHEDLYSEILELS